MIRFGRDSSDGGEHGWKGHCGKEVCGAAERGGTRATASADPQRKEPGEAALEGAHVVEGRCLGSRRGVERQQDHRGARYQRLHGLPGAQATGGRGLCGGVEPQAARAAAGARDFRRRDGSQADRLGVLQAAQGTRALDVAAVGEQGRGARHRRSRQRLNDRADAQKTFSSPIADSNGSSRRRPTARS